jgi:arginase family enzyme
MMADFDASNSGGYNVPLAANPFDSWATVLDCGDVPVTSYDPEWAIHQIEEGHNSILMRKPATHADEPGLAKKGETFPRVITMGGDHSITLPILRSMNRAYGPVRNLGNTLLCCLEPMLTSFAVCITVPLQKECPTRLSSNSSRSC